MDLRALLGELGAEMTRLEEELRREALASPGALEEAVAHLFRAGGKRLRPAFVLLAGRFFAYDPERLVPLAAALELVHLATLVHDDVIDEAPLRRGLPTVKARWGDFHALCTGDYLFARALALVARYGDEAIASHLARVSLQMCAGEIEQIVTAGCLDVDLRAYLRRIKRKTALLFSSCCYIGALASGAPPVLARALQQYGYYLGMAFQITDDLLDFLGSEEELGKPVGSDLRQGIITLPVLCALRHPRLGPRLRELLASGVTDGAWEEVRRLVAAAGGLDRARLYSCRYLEKAKRRLELLPELPPRRVLAGIADFVATRNF